MSADASRPPAYVQRLARLPEVFARAAAYPAGVPLAELAAQFATTVDDLRDDLITYYSVDPGEEYGLSRPYTLEFVRRDGEEAEPGEAEVIRVSEAADLGADLLTPGELAELAAVAADLLALDPDDEALAGALATISVTLLPELSSQTSWTMPLGDDPIPRVLAQAVTERRRVRISYSRQWQPGARERTIEPYALTLGHHGWEVEAGPVLPSADGRLGIRTYLVDNVLSAELTDDTFERPADVDGLIARNRETTSVTLELPTAAAWAARFFAESVSILDEDGETTTVELELLPPVERRVGLITLAGGLDTRVVSPGSLVAAGPALAAELLSHHRGGVHRR